jgi:hypothetical protein
MWRYQVIQLFRDAHKQSELLIPPSIRQQLNHTFTFNQLLDKLYQKTWIVHCAKPSNHHKHNVNYLGRYTKRPPIAESKLRHYDGTEVMFKYLDHTTKTYRNFTVTAEKFIARFIQHIPDVGFRMIRYYGFLAHRVRGKLLPLVYQLLKQEAPQPTPLPSYAQLIEKDFNVKPLTCILCGQPLRLAAVCFGETSAYQLLRRHRQLALLQKI